MFDVSQKKQLWDIFKEIPKDKSAIQRIPELLEDKRLLPYSPDDKRYQAFCEAYTIKLIQSYVRDKDRQQILLATYQLLDGYNNDKIKVTARRKLYISKAAGSNKLVKAAWGDPNGSLQNIEEKTVEELVKRLIKEITNNGNVTRELN